MLLRAAIAGDEKAYATFLGRTATIVRGFARRKIVQGGVDPEDIVQETLLALHMKRHTWISDAPVLPWVYAIARFKLIDAPHDSCRKSPISSPKETWDSLRAYPGPEFLTSYAERRKSPFEPCRLFDLILMSALILVLMPEHRSICPISKIRSPDAHSGRGDRDQFDRFRGRFRQHRRFHAWSSRRRWIDTCHAAAALCRRRCEPHSPLAPEHLLFLSMHSQTSASMQPRVTSGGAAQSSSHSSA